MFETILRDFAIAFGALIVIIVIVDGIRRRIDKKRRDPP